MEMIGRRQKNSALVKFHLPGLIDYAGFRSGDPAPRRNISIVSTIEDQDLASIRYGEQIPIWIDGESHNMPKFGFRPLDDPNWCGISVGIPAKNVDAPSRKASDEDLSILQIQTNGVRRHQLRAGPLNHAQRMLRTRGGRAEDQNA